MRNDAAAQSPPQWDFDSVYRFGRFSAISFTWMTVLLGAATVCPSAPGRCLAVLLAIGLAFHLFAYVHNDVMDLALDRTEPNRQDSPLVRGMISPDRALAIAIVQVPIAFALHLTLNRTGPASAAALAIAFALLALYNAWGKRWRIPILGDFVQALGWMALAGYGALAASGAAPASTGIPVVTSTLLALVLLYVLMINGIHGGLRDLANDYQRGARTTAILLGARPGGAASPGMFRPLMLYAFALQLLIFAVIAACLVLNIPGYRKDLLYATVAIVIAAHLALAYFTRSALTGAAGKRGLIRAGILHLVISLGLLYWPFAFFFSGPVSLTILAAYVLPVGFMLLHDGLGYESE